ncbi:MAG: acyltransferase, partial [Planctomycetota bacterium]
MNWLSTFIKPARTLKVFIRSPFSTITLLVRRHVLRLKGVTFGRKLCLEGHIDVTVGRNVRLGDYVRLGKDVYLGTWPTGKFVVGDNSYIGRWSIILAHESVVIGSDCLIAPGCHITDVNHGIAPGELIRKQRLVSKPVRIGNDVWVGVGSSILPGVTIGNSAVIGARSVVTHDVPDGAIVAGVPARILRYRKESTHKSS